MIIVCQKCSTRLQVDDEKSPSRPFNVRCPKCNNTVSAGPATPATEQSALTVGGSPATDHPRVEQSTARAFGSTTPSVGTASGDETVRMLVDLLWTNDSRAGEHGHHQIELEPYGYRWFRARGLDRNVPRE